jgi:integration host factor subunit alpha
MTLTRAGLAEILFDTGGFGKNDAKDLVDSFFEEVSRSLEGAIEVKLADFGNFQLRSKAERPGRNPRTGEEAPIAARRVVTFHASEKLKMAVGNADHSPAFPDSGHGKVPPAISSAARR